MRFLGAIGRAFWRFMVVFSFMVNVVLLVVVIAFESINRGSRVSYFEIMDFGFGGWMILLCGVGLVLTTLGLVKAVPGWPAPATRAATSPARHATKRPTTGAVWCSGLRTTGSTPTVDAGCAAAIDAAASSHASRISPWTANRFVILRSLFQSRPSLRTCARQLVIGAGRDPASCLSGANAASKVGGTARRSKHKHLPGSRVSRIHRPQHRARRASIGRKTAPVAHTPAAEPPNSPAGLAGRPTADDFSWSVMLGSPIMLPLAREPKTRPQAPGS